MTAPANRLICTLTLLTALMVSSGCGRSKPQANDMRFGGGNPVQVLATEVATRTHVDRFTALGTAQANEAIEVTSRISSVVKRINFAEGESVKAGALLVELDNDELRANVAMAEAGLKQKQSQYRRSQSLGKTRVVSESELEELEANVSMADAELRAAQARLNNSFIRAPFAGTVGLRRVSLGDLVGPDTRITTLDDRATMKLEFTIPETFLATVSLDQTIDAQSSVYPNKAFTGIVSSIDSRIDPTTRALTVFARIPNEDDALKPGMFLTVDLEQQRENVLLIPEEALMPRRGLQFVFVVESGKAKETQVELGTRTPGFAEIRSGLTIGDIIITEGTQKVRDGAPVEIKAAT